MKKITVIFVSLLMLFTFCGCSEDKGNKDIVIIYTNDVHTYVNNQTKQDDGTYSKDLNYASVKALKDDLTAEGKTVFLVDNGDNIQGTAYGSYDKGLSVINIMNSVGYDLSSVGNHEFDFGFDGFENAIAQADFDYLCANLYNVQKNESYLDGTKIIEKNGVKVGFIGVTTPDTMSSVANNTFQDDNGNQLYTFIGFENQTDLYNLVQKEIDAIKKKVDYVVVLGHLGVSESSLVTSYDLINNTNGIDLFIDGHSHTVMENEIVKNNKDEDVVLTQTGSYLKNIGVATLSKTDGIKTELISEYDNYDEDVQALSDELVNNVEIQMGQVIGDNEANLVIYDGDTRIVRTVETAISDFIADSYYYYMNEVAGLNTDVAVVNGGGIRTSLNEGIFTLLDVNAITPFGNTLLSANIKGSDLKAYLNHVYAEYGTTDENGKAAEMPVIGGLFTAGIKFEINVNNEDKVDNIEVYNKETNEYEPLDLDKKYAIAGYHYLLLDNLDTYPELENLEVVATYITTDYLATAEYIKSFAEENGLPTIRSANSPLSKYTNYLINYEDYLGSGRISVVK